MPDDQDERKAIVAAGYDRMTRRYGAWAAEIEDDPRDRMTGELMARVPEGSRVLDIGCGSGVPSTIVLAERFDVVGIDISAEQIALARERVPKATFIVGDVTGLDQPAGSFDAVTAFYSINHMPREEHAGLFARVAGWLRPGGLFLAALGAGDDPGWTGEWLGVPMFFSSFDADTNRALLVAAGFALVLDEVVEIQEPDGGVPFHWVLAQRY